MANQAQVHQEAAKSKPDLHPPSLTNPELAHTGIPVHLAQLLASLSLLALANSSSPNPPTPTPKRSNPPTPPDPQSPVPSPPLDLLYMLVPLERSSCPKHPALFMFMEEGKERDPLRINSWFNCIHRYSDILSISDDIPEALRYYGAYCRDKALDKYTQYENISRPHTVTQQKSKCEVYFLPSTSTDTSYEKWIAVMQTVTRKIALIIKIVITIETLRDGQLSGPISDYSVKQRPLDPIDIKLRQDVSHHITLDNPFDKLVSRTEKDNAQAYAIGLNGSKSEASDAVSNAVSQGKPTCLQPLNY
ncbi:hypothetical protein HOY80DRAFT_997186 [Tuber brumale]|nr:hypothetical protein HOY80DRAFT_997186 [Tuber brumale]